MSSATWNIPNAGMLLTETLNFSIGAAFFVGSVFKAILTYSSSEDKRPGSDHIKGTGLNQALPDALPSVVDIKKVIPKHCFQSSIPLSMYHAAKDFVQVLVAFLALTYLETVVESVWLKTVLFLLYWFVQGTFLFALFVLGHDCGHGSFSTSSLLNDAVGTVTHGVLMVPYYQWKLSHRNHHKFTCNFDRDEVFYPVRKSQQSRGMTLPGFAFGFGWFIYLAVGYNPRRVKHFNPVDPMFLGHFVGCLFSLGSLGAMLLLCYQFYAAYGFAALTVYYLVPLFVMGTYIVVVTFLHHSELNIPWYADGEWDFVKGQLSTIDRDYGIVHHVIHSIGTHQMHHMFTKIPHYHLEEATKHFRKAFPQLVRSCDEAILPSFARMFSMYEKHSIIDDEAKQMVYK